MSLKINYAKFSAVFALPQLSEQTLCTASAEALRLLLYLMQNQPQVIDPRYLADRLMIPYQQVLDGLDFWCREGLLCHQEQPVEQTCQPQPQPEAIQQPQPKTRREPVVSVGLQAQKKTMSIDEIDHLSQQDANISQLVEMVQMQMGKALTRTEIETLVSFYTYAGLPPEYILLAVSFCCAKNMPNMRAVSRLLTDMMSENIYTYEQAEEYLTRRQRQDSAQGQVKTAFGIHDRQLTRQECKYIDTWFLNYRFDISMVKLAYERTVKNTGKAAMAYMNKILSNWNEKGYRTVREINQKDGGKKYQASDTEQSYDIDLLDRYWDNVPTLD